MAENDYTQYEVEKQPKRRWKRIILWSSLAIFLIIALVAGGSYLWFRAQVSSANDRVTPEVRAALQDKPSTSLTTQADAAGSGASGSINIPSPSAMNLLVIGSDRRVDDPSLGVRSDTLMIVHIDPDKDYLAVLSLPRDLRVEVPGHGKGKLNTAFANGGAVLAIKTVEQATGVDINHYLEVGFDAFADIVNSLGGVYVDVDKRYHNDDYDYELIDLYPGYQLLGGADALDYVRYRHDRNADFGRMDRQQTFISALREQAMGWDLPFKLPGLISALFRNTTTDLSANDLLRLSRWGIGLSGDDIRALSLHGDTPTIGGASYVTATEDQIARAVDQLLYSSSSDDPDAAQTTSTTSPASASTTEKVDLNGISVDVKGASGRTGDARAAAEWLRSLGGIVGANVEDTASTRERSVIEYPSGMSADAERVGAATGIDRFDQTSRVDRVTLLIGEDLVLPAAFAPAASPDTIPDPYWWKLWAPRVPYAVQAPSYLPEGYSWVRRFPDTYPTYPIRVGNGEKPAFRMLYASGDNDDQVMGITETTWLDAPAATKGLQVVHDGVTFTVVRNDTKVVRVWWKADGVLYFVSNTLSHWLSQEEMLRVAESMIPVPKQ